MIGNGELKKLVERNFINCEFDKVIETALSVPEEGLLSLSGMAGVLNTLPELNRLRDLGQLVGRPIVHEIAIALNLTKSIYFENYDCEPIIYFVSKNKMNNELSQSLGEFVFDFKGVTLFKKRKGVKTKASECKFQHLYELEYKKIICELKELYNLSGKGGRSGAHYNMDKIRKYIIDTYFIFYLFDELKDERSQKINDLIIDKFDFILCGEKRRKMVASLINWRILLDASVFDSEFHKAFNPFKIKDIKQILINRYGECI